MAKRGGFGFFLRELNFWRDLRDLRGKKTVDRNQLSVHRGFFVLRGVKKGAHEEQNK